MIHPTRHHVYPQANGHPLDAPAVVSQWDSALDIDRPNRLISLFAPANDIDPIAFVRGGQGAERFYWAEPTGDSDAITLAGLGVAAEVRVPPVLVGTPAAGSRFDSVTKLARRLFRGALFHAVDGIDRSAGQVVLAGHPARPRLFGGFAFQDDFVPDNTWSVFSPAHFILPHYQYARVDGRAYLTINALVAPGEDVAESLAGMREALLARLAAPLLLPTQPVVQPTLRYPMSPDTWRDMLTQAMAEIHAGSIQKVVLSRVCEVRAEQLIDAAATLDSLNTQYGDCYRFLFEPLPFHAFFGATPELLIRKIGPRAQTMALAGSIARGQSAREDERLATQLLASPKERQEHALVVEAIRQDLATQMTTLTIPTTPRVWRLRNIQHLLTAIEGQLTRPEMGVLPLVRRLHPTPAMGGAPAERALAFLRRVEPVPRGWYAAPIGWLDSAQDGVFAVAIRSAVTQHARAWLYAGAGIVSDSQPAQEWAETALKFRPMLGALGVEESA